MVLICMSLIIRDVEHLFICHLAVCKEGTKIFLFLVKPTSVLHGNLGSQSYEMSAHIWLTIYIDACGCPRTCGTRARVQASC